MCLQMYLPHAWIMSSSNTPILNFSKISLLSRKINIGFLLYDCCWENLHKLGLDLGLILHWFLFFALGINIICFAR